MFGRLLIALLAVLPTHALSRAAGFLATRRIPTPLRERVFRGYASRVRRAPRRGGAPARRVPDAQRLLHARPQAGAPPRRRGRDRQPGRRGGGRVRAGGARHARAGKGRDYSLAALLGDRALADRMEGGTYATLYLAPKDYHRLHWPVDGAVTRATYVPGSCGR
jgi:phosphatidylserine decarboxylase